MAKKKEVSGPTDVPEIVTEPIELDPEFGLIAADIGNSMDWLENQSEPALREEYEVRADDTLVDEETIQAVPEDDYRHDEIRIHVVQSGESLQDIAEKELGDAGRFVEIVILNEIGEDDIQEGQILKLPEV